MVRLLLIVSGTVLLVAGILAAQIQPDPESWFFTAQEIEIAYRYQEGFGERLRNPLKARDCLLGQTKFVASYQGREFAVPCHFIKETIRHLAEMLKIGAAKYLFPLDLDHAHFALPTDIWKKKYSKLPWHMVFPALLEEPSLVALYHASEHLTVVDPKTGKVDLEASAWKDKRNILGFYDGRPIVILPPHPTGMGVAPPKPYQSYGTFGFLSSPRGELFIFLGNKVVSFDITFEIGDAELEQLVPKSVVKKPTN
jgi:hypothetical protein